MTGAEFRRLIPRVLIAGVIEHQIDDYAQSKVVRRSKQLLNDVWANIFGVVLNNINLQSHDYYYYQSYYGQKYYEKEA